MKIKKFIGDRKFYKMVFAVAVPIMIQNGITNFVNMLDNIMVGQIGTDAMSGVSIANQFIFIFNLFIFGAVSGPGIFGAQFYGNGDEEGLRETFRFKLIICTVLGIVGVTFMCVFRNELISLFLHEGGETGNIEQTLKFGGGYLLIDIIGIAPYILTQCYSSTLRETGETVLPMKAGLAAVAVNLILNYILIFGKFGIPAFGPYGAALATVSSRIVECLIVVIWTHIHKDKNGFIKNAYRSFKVKKKLVKQIFVKGTPLFFNEGLWALGMAALTQIYSYRGLEVVAAMNISSTLYNVFNIVFVALGNAISIIIGQILGSGKMEEAKESAGKLIFFTLVTSFAVTAVIILCASFFPNIYNTSDEVRHLARKFIFVVAVSMPIESFMNAAYFTLRSGGKTLITFLFDSVYIWVIYIPCAVIFMKFTDLPIEFIYLAVQMTGIVKCILGYILVKKGVWLNNMVSA